jgi:two-component system, NarL family, nitrate/nitrite response regulator NarL
MRIVLCDDHRLLIEAFGTALRTAGHDVVAMATTPEDGYRAVCEQYPDACLLDVLFPCGSGLDAVARIAADRPACRVLMLSARADPVLVRTSLAAGAAGFVRKGDSVAGILRALSLVGAGEIAVDPELLRAAVRTRSHVPVPAPGQQLRFLSGREREALRDVLAGRSTKEIAQEMGVSLNTARTHVQNVLTKLGVHTRLQAVALVAREDLGAELGLDAR